MATVLETAGAKAPDSIRDPEPLYEIINGIRVDLPPMSIYANLIAKRLLRRIDPLVEDAALGTATMEALLVLDESADLKRRPDVTFVSAERWPLEREIPAVGEWVVVPDLAVEVISPHDVFADVLAKVHEYFDHDVRQVWVVVPEEQQVYVYRSPTEVTILGAEQTLECNLLPGLCVPLAELFRRSTARRP